VSVEELEQAVAGLSEEELRRFRDWFAGFEAEAWDRQFERDVAAGRLDALAEAALLEIRTVAKPTL
jgi:hypothetical protein